MRIKGQRISSLALISRLLLFLIVWWALSGGVAGSWVIGVPAVLCALLVSAVLLPPTQLVWWQLVAFIPFFLWQSLKSGVDVALFAFRPRMSLAPKLIDYPLRLPLGLAQVTMINVISLLPGTLSAKLNKGVLTVHVLDSQGNYLADLQSLEQRLERIFPGPTIREDQ